MDLSKGTPQSKQLLTGWPPRRLLRGRQAGTLPPPPHLSPRLAAAGEWLQAEARETAVAGLMAATTTRASAGTTVEAGRSNTGVEACAREEVEAGEARAREEAGKEEAELEQPVWREGGGWVAQEGGMDSDEREASAPRDGGAKRLARGPESERRGSVEAGP